MTSERDPRISIIAVDGSFRERFHLLDGLAKQSLRADDYELIWVEHYGNVKPELVDRIRQRPGSRIITLNRKGTYHSSHCFNAGIQAARGKLIVIPDADVIIEEHFLEQVCEEHETNEKLVLYIHRYDEPKDEHLPEIDLDRLRRTCVLRNPTNYGGCLTVRKRWLSRINGYELHSAFGGGFHANGLDVYTRLKNLGLHVMWHPSLKLFHPWHPGTLVRSDAYERQVAIIRFRQLALDYLPLNGIDTALDREMPAELASDLAAARGQGRTMVQRVSSFLKRGVE